MRKSRRKAGLKAKKTNALLKRLVAFVRVSSREQEREGWSLDVQEAGLYDWAKRNGGVIVKIYRIAETATKAEQRTVFKEFLAYVKANAKNIDGVLFYKISRASRNLPDYVQLEGLELEHNIEFISATEPTQNTPAGRMFRRQLAIMCAFFTEQQSVDVREGHARRVQEGLFCGLAPYGYRNVRVNDRSLVEVDKVSAGNVKLIFNLYAYKNHTIDMIVAHVEKEGIIFRPETPKWNRATVHRILRDRSYIGDLFYQDVWHPGTHKHLIDRPTWDRVQVLMGDKQRRSHELTYAGELIKCNHCGRPITGECVRKKSPKTGEVKEHVYYRCVKYKAENHPSIRLKEVDLDEQIMVIFRSILLPQTIREWFGRMLVVWSQDEQKASGMEAEQVQRQLSSLRTQKDKLLNLNLLGAISDAEFSAKNTEIRDRIADYTLKLEAADRGRDEHADLARKAFELSQSLPERWLNADYSTKRQLLEMVGLNFWLDGVSLVVEWRKPFDMLVGGLSVSSDRGDKI